MKNWMFAALAILVLLQLGGHGVRAEVTKFINALVVVDNSLFMKHWSDASDEDIKCYFKTIISGTAKRLESIGNPSVTLSMYDFYIIKDSCEADFLKFFTNSKGVELPLIKTISSRTEFYNWLEQPDNKYATKDYDVVIVYTSSEVAPLKVSAILGSFCGEKVPVVFVTDEGPFMSIDATAHGLGFSLGSRRDGDQNKCESSKHYIMSDKRLQILGSSYDKHLEFSPCSIDYIKAFFESKGSSCLANGHLSQCTEDDSCGIEDAGQRYPLQDQCRFAKGLDSRLCVGNHDREQEMCKEVYCSVDMEEYCEVVMPVDGTKCGFNKWCQDGECVTNPNGKDSTDCEDMDSDKDEVLTVDGKMSCKEISENYPYICMHEYYSNFCCRTCSEGKFRISGPKPKK